jgi:hypothetical protein
MILAACCGLAFACGGCQNSAPQTTLLRAADLEVSTNEVVQQLAQSKFLTSRTSSSPPLTIQPKPMENFSDNRLSAGDQWAAMSRVLLKPEVVKLLGEKNISVQMPALQNTRLVRAGLSPVEPAAAVAPTHLFQSRLSTLVRSAGSAPDKTTARQDTFLFDYEIVEVQSRRVEWSGQTQLKRLANGRLYD